MKFLKSCNWLAIIIIAEGVVLGLLAYARLVPGGFDGFQHFHLQFYFLNNAVISHEVPQWIPQLTHGSVASWWYVVQAGLGANVLLSVGLFCPALIKSVNFIYLYHAGFLIDEIFFLTGVWLLAGRFYTSRLTAFWVTATIGASTVWAMQPWYNFHSFYAIPWLLVMWHRLVETKQWRYLFFLVGLLALQALGNLIYVLPLTMLIVTGYALFYSIGHWHEVKCLRPNWRAGLALLGGIAALAMVYAIISWGTGDIVNYSFARGSDGRVGIDAFLTYGRNMGFGKWGEMVLGISPFQDMTLFSGYLTLPLLFITCLFAIGRRNAHVLALIVMLMLLSMGTWLSQLLYYAWPGMNFFRHLSLMSPVIKLFLCFFAGFGLDALLRQQEKKETWLGRASIFLGLGLIGIALFLYGLAQDKSFAVQVLKDLVEGTVMHVDQEHKVMFLIPGLSAMVEEGDVALRLMINAAGAFVLGCGLLFSARASGQWRNFCMIGLVVIHLAGLYSYKMFEYRAKMVTVNGAYQEMLNFQPMPYHPRRVAGDAMDEGRDKFLSVLKFSPVYWTTYAFLFKDTIDHGYRTDYWLKPFDHYMRAYNGQPLDDLSQDPIGLSRFLNFRFPLALPSSGKIAGLSEDKIQFFSTAYGVDDDTMAARMMSDPQYQGDVVLVESKMLAKPTDLSLQARLPLAYTIKQFSANHVELTIDHPSGEAQWLLYSDVWHPSWHAFVDGKPTPIFKANIAYKAIQLPPGAQNIHFDSHSKMLEILFRFIAVTALIVFVIILKKII